MPYILLCLLAVFTWGCNKSTSKQNTDARTYLQSIQQSLKPLHKRMYTPQRGEWLAEHPENGQPFYTYIEERGFDAALSKKWIVVLPIGEFSTKQAEILDKTIAYLGTFYQLRTKKLPSLADVPAKATRMYEGKKQIYTHYVLDELLYPQIKDSIACFLAFTATDLYPDPKWNFVFGQASLQHRVGVWSMNRFDYPDMNEASYKACLHQTIKTAIHEAGHIFGLHHCTDYVCCMSGSNSLEESATHPIGFCPDCTAKVGWHFGLDLLKQHQELANFWQKEGIEAPLQYYSAAGKALRAHLKP